VSNFEVPNPILSSPFEEPKEHWWILEGEPAERRPGRRPALYFYRDPKRETDERGGLAIEMKLVNLIRERVKAWRESGHAGVTRTTLELLQHWRRDGRDRRLFFAQIEAVETIIFLVEARADFRQGLEIPRDEPSDDRKAEGFTGFASRIQPRRRTLAKKKRRRNSSRKRLCGWTVLTASTRCWAAMDAGASTFAWTFRPRLTSWDGLASKRIARFLGS
jgi:hypothetical protein